MTDDDTDISFSNLSRHDADPRVADRIRRRALGVLHEERDRLAHPWRGRAGRFWDLVEPIFSSAVVCAYFVWMVRTLATVMR
jgi:hypothetical protein